MEANEFDIRNMLGLLRRRFMLILITIFVVVSATSVVVFSLTPVFQASTLILVDPSRKNLLEGDAEMLSSAADSARIDSEVEIMRADTVLLRVIDRLQLTQDEEFGVSLSLRAKLLGLLRMAQPALPTGEEALNQTLNKLRSALTVQRRGSTYLLVASVRSEQPRRAAEIANAVAEAYIADQLSSKVNSILATRDVLQGRIAAARTTVQESEGSFDAFVQANIDSIVRDTGRTDLANMQAQITQLQQQRTQTVAVAEAVQNSLQNQDFASLSETLQSDALAQLERQRQELQTSLSAAATDSPIAIDLRAELASIEERLSRQAVTEVNALRDSVTQYQSQEATLRQDLRTGVLQSSLSPDVLTRIYELQQNAELARQQYQTLLARVQTVEAQAALQIADSRIVSPALAPSGAAFPNTLLFLGIALAAAIAIGVGLALLYENFLGGFVTEAQLQSNLRARVLTSIPWAKPKGSSDTTVANLMVDSPLSGYAESIRRLQAAVEHSLRRRNPNKTQADVIMVTSTAPAEGKSTTALALARSYALSGRSTLLIDSDLRKPTIHRQLGIEPSMGLLEFLQDPHDDNFQIDSIVTRDPMTNTTIVTGARRSGIPTDQLISGHAFRRLLQASRAAFDVIVIDSPPIGPIVDGLYIAPLADVIVFVVRWGSTSQVDTRAAVASLAEVTPENTEILPVLNQQAKSAASYRSKYDTYYSESY
jgi:capsular exopolysaccharide synthesis family protein